MKKNTIIYWISTGLLSVMMLFSAYNYITNPQMLEAFKHLGFPDYFRQELAVAKVIGAIVQILPQVPIKIKDWAYAGFGITFISAAVAHFSLGDPASVAAAPIVFLVVLVVSYVFLHRKNKPVIATFNKAIA